MDIYEEALEMHKKNKGKIDIVSKVETKDEHDLSLAYTPGVAEPCRVIAANPGKLNTYTSRVNMIAVVSDGSAVLGLGNIGARAALPVMEGKCVLFKQFGGVSAFPLCIDSQDSKVIVDTVKLLEPSFAGINLEDIQAPRCFEIEERLKKETGMIIFHDDQHGTAVVTLAGILNALTLCKKDIGEVKVVISGAGAAGTSITDLLIYTGAADIIICDRHGIIYRGRESLNSAKKKLAEITNKDNIKGNLSDALEDADIFIGVSAGGLLKGEMIKKMKEDPVIFALANPEPEIKPELTAGCGVKIIATGRSDYPNQVNNVLAFPGILRGALDSKAIEINREMKIAAAKAISGIVGDDLKEDYIIPKPFDRRVLPAVAVSVAKSAADTKNTRGKVNLEAVEKKARKIASRI
ncbi:MAG: NADP-dependent malic enzyme [Actinomycetota bacterium]|nr:NADP-dependent malic enzyme [Actinomycetota bacterium]